MSWTLAEAKIVKELYPYSRKNKKELLKKLPHRSWSAIKMKAWRLGITNTMFGFDFKEYNLTETEKAWLAGFIDGEGCVGVYLCKSYKEKKYPKPNVGISNTHKGSMIFVSKLLKQGTAQWYPAKSKGKKYKKCYNVVISGIPSVYPLLKNILPYLIVKKKQAEYTLRWCKLYMNRETIRTKEPDECVELRRKIKELNKRGVSY